jgi:hypothetical protein
MSLISQFRVHHDISSWDQNTILFPVLLALDEASELGYTAAFQHNAQVAQLVEHCTENAGVGGSSPPLGTTLFLRLLKSFMFSPLIV